ncbi:MAG TPA: nitroreductase family protein [Candidatus Hydrogenedentes bacterium]|nr:nitroreductase family protein [Candidatus Hydrogenedentota bacterium]HPG65490.1 nitroreductase family protein [Candidatus Hydrogenedentota bacterium]
MPLRDLILRNRSYRRFYEEEPIESEVLRELVDLARFSASGANLQPLRFVISNTTEQTVAIFPHLGWAGYLSDWPGPVAGERPSAYITILCDKEASASPGCDHGIAAQSILLGAAEKGLGGCMIGSIDRKGLRTTWQLPERYDIVLVIALGKPKETVVLEAVGSDGSIKYWRDENGVHHVPKRALDDIIVEV